MRRARAYITLIAASLMMMLGACSHKEIVDPDGSEQSVKVAFMWDSVPYASPKGMTIYFFPLDPGGKVWRYDIPGRDGGATPIPAGNYHMLAYNNDQPGIEVAGFTSAHGCTASAVCLPDDVTYGTGELFCAMVSPVSVTPCGVKYTAADGQEKECPQGLVRAYPQRRYCDYEVIVRNIEGLEYVRSAQVWIDGMASEINMASGQLDQRPVTLAVRTERVAHADELRGESTALGACTELPEITATLKIARTDGVGLEKAFNVTRQILDAPRPHHVVVVIDGVDIPAPGEGGGEGGDVGLDVGVEGWQVIYIDITT